MSPKIKLAQSRSQGEIIDDSIIFLKQNLFALLKSYFTICGLFWIAGIALSILNKTQIFQLQEQEESIYTLSYWATIFLSYLNFILGLLTSLSFIKVYFDKGNETPTVEEVWGYFKYYFLKVFSSAFLLTFLFAAGSLMCLIPGFYLLPVILMILTVMVMENEDLGRAFNRGFQLLKDSWWNLFAILVVTSIITVSCITLFIIPIAIIVGAILYLTNANHSHTIGIAITATYHALQFLFIFPAISLALTYFDLNEKLDDNGLMQRIAMVGKKTEITGESTTEEY